MAKRTRRKPPSGYFPQGSARPATRRSGAQIQREIDEILTGKSDCACVRAGACNCHRMHVTERCECPSCREPQTSHEGHSTKKTFDWASFTEGAAFGFWAAPYISEVENLAEDAREETGENSRKGEALREAYEALSPSSGDTWEDIMPEPPSSALVVAKKFTKATKEQLTDEQLTEILGKFSAHDAGYRGAMQSQGEGIGWFDEGVNVDPPRGFNDDPKIQNAVYRAIARGAREAGVRLPRR